MPPNSLAAVAAEITAKQGRCKILRFQDLGGSLTPPSGDPLDWWEPENLTHRAELHGIKASAGTFFDAITAWTATAHKAGTRNRRATDGRPDCPYNGQRPASSTPDTPAAWRSTERNHSRELLRPIKTTEGSMPAPRFNDRIITDGLPDGWFIQDRICQNEALLCRRSDFAFGGSLCICTRPRALPTDEWLTTARTIAHGFETENACRRT
ncbi:hypothetical protein [Pseudophaeobacter flagellatus]|uniref:hypothetical protein n=1 Tax=Pseudophaeobacter flagellatus TaxID=2899119 RepID=UPI001E406646|nr:hypothetical protein [Pseudophaeobacter flagellatus]MCD9149084.1 hypothetical protein [Pseudophaeobacter flagellatus]